MRANALQLETVPDGAFVAVGTTKGLLVVVADTVAGIISNFLLKCFRKRLTCGRRIKRNAIAIALDKSTIGRVL
jgi:hypothetical protein